MKLTWDQVLAWRLQRQLLDPRGRESPVEVARRLCGVQAQVASSAELAVAVRQVEPRRGEVGEALDERLLVKTWAMRGTLHLLPADEAAGLPRARRDGALVGAGELAAHVRRHAGRPVRPRRGGVRGTRRACPHPQ